MTPNVTIFILDTINRRQVSGFGGPPRPGNFLERVLRQGTWFSSFYPAGGTTRVSVNALFNGFFGSASGLNHQHCAGRFAAGRAVTLTQLFRHHGYRVQGFTQGDVSLDPAGFETLHIRQPRYTAESLAPHFVSDGRPVFTYLHFYAVHDPAFAHPEKMTPAHYRRCLDDLSTEIEGIWETVVGKDGVAVIASDHGCRLRESADPAWRFFREDEPTAGMFLSEATVGGICSLVGADLFPARELRTTARGVDILPTLCEALGMKHPPVQGRSLWPAIAAGEEPPPMPAFVETGGLPLTDGRAAADAVIRDGWKLVRHATHGEALYHVAADPLEEWNRLGENHPRERQLRALRHEQEAENARGVAEIYGEAAGFAAELRQRYPAPAEKDVVRGARPFSLAGLIDDRVRQYLRHHLAVQAAGWSAAGPRIVLCSASEHASAFMEALPPGAAAAVEAILDANPEARGGTFLGKPVRRPEDYLAQETPDLIVVAHHHYAGDIMIRLKNALETPVPVVGMYHLDREIPMWWDITS
ncbi:hypothetical protein CSB20_10740 [bacterium DOLZORAL124_64_63]|nr:MAG: hypothetical protein CSB20_10740 [bacterium DOLZORAL124_64_63]